MKNFPYPVLGNGNDISGEFLPDMTYSINSKRVEIKCTLKTTNSYISNLIAEGKAHYSVEIECGNTFYRKMETTSSDNITVEMPANSLKEKVEVRFYICAATKIANYHPDGTNPIFAEEQFVIEEGDILALGGSSDFIVAKKFDPLKAPISSIIKLTGSEKRNDGEMRVKYDEDKIIIELSKNDHSVYSQVKNSSVEMLHSALVLPVLVDAINGMNGNGNNSCQEYAWSDKLKKICDERKISLDDPLCAAQKILDNPIGRTLNWRKKAEENEND